MFMSVHPDKSKGGWGGGGARTYSSVHGCNDLPKSAQQGRSILQQERHTDLRRTSYLGNLEICFSPALSDFAESQNWWTCPNG